MGKVVTFRISGRSVETDAPTAEDLLDQIRDYLEILRGVEEAIAEDGQRAIDWRVVNASKASPLSLQLEAFAHQYAVNVDVRVSAVLAQTAAGLHQLQHSPERPNFFSDRVLARAEKIFERVTNGLDLSEIDFGADLPASTITPAVARNGVRNARLAQTPIERNYKELGAVEGYFHSVERDGYGRSLLWIRHRLSGSHVKCILTGAALRLVAQQEINEVFRGRRLLINGTIHYKAMGVISQIEADEVSFFPPRGDLPGLNDIIDENFTGGLTTTEFLERMRNGNLS